MAKFLTTSAVTYHIENIIVEANKKLVLVSPFIKITKTFLERLKDTSERGVQVILIYGKSELSSSEKKQIDSISQLKLYYFDNLHAKCYFNEREMVITSMNLYEFSEKNNREMGILITKKVDEVIFNDAVNETHSIIKSAIEITTKPKNSKGFCIRCGNKVNYDAEKPLCRDCYYEWSIWENYDYLERFCHCCGKPNETSMARPECYNCFTKNL